MRGRRLRPQPRVQEKSTRVSHHGHTGIPAFPAAMVLRLTPGSPRRSGFLSPSPAQCASIVANLTPASRRQDHMASPSARVLFVKSTFASIASRTHVRDDREAPLLVARDGRQSAGDFRKGSTEQSCDQLARRANQLLRAKPCQPRSRVPDAVRRVSAAPQSRDPSSSNRPRISSASRWGALRRVRGTVHRRLRLALYPSASARRRLAIIDTLSR
jgi:hypothetical protein